MWFFKHYFCQSPAQLFLNLVKYFYFLLLLHVTNIVCVTVKNAPFMNKLSAEAATKIQILNQPLNMGLPLLLFLPMDPTCLLYICVVTLKPTSVERAVWTASTWVCKSCCLVFQPCSRGGLTRLPNWLTCSASNKNATSALPMTNSASGTALNPDILLVHVLTIGRIRTAATCIFCSLIWCKDMQFPHCWESTKIFNYLWDSRYWEWRHSIRGRLQSCSVRLQI